MKTIYTTTRTIFLKATLILLIILSSSAIFTSCTADEIETSKIENLTIEMNETFLQRKDSLGNTGKDDLPITPNPFPTMPPKK